MERHDKTALTFFLDQHIPNWRTVIPNLFDHLVTVELKQNQIIPIERESLHFILTGSLGLYNKDQPLRFCIAGELLLLNPGSNDRHIKAIEDVRIFHLHHEDYFRLSADILALKNLYDSLLRQQHSFKEFRAKLRELDKSQRLAAFRKKYPTLVYKIKRYELAKYLGISITLLRQQLQIVN